MTTLRLIALMLMAVLLPLRGTLAAAQPCLGASSGPAAVVQAAPGDHHGMHDSAHHAEQSAEHPAEHPAPTQDGAVAPAADADADTSHHGSGCQASACCLMPLASAPQAAAALRLHNQLRFPALLTPALAFQCGGQDRPPKRG